MNETRSASGPKDILNSSMTSEELSGELDFYRRAYGSDPEYDARRRIERGFGWEDRVSPTVVELVESLKLAEDASNQRFLDLGCGDGRSSEYFLNLGFDTTGVDFSPEALKLYESRFKDNPKVHSARTDLTAAGTLGDLGQFDLVLDWSVLDHIRPQYLPQYLDNVVSALKTGGHIIVSEFDTLPDLPPGQDWKIVGGHFSKIYKTEALIELFKGLELVDSRKNTLEDTKNNIYFNTAVFLKKD